MANPLRMRCELISTKLEEKKIIHFHDKKAGRIKEKNFIFRRLIKLITSDEDINFRKSFNLAAKKSTKVVRKIKI